MTSGVACVLFTDLVGSTELMGRLGDARFDALRAEHFACLRQAVTTGGGVEVKTTGDGLLATFASAVDALVAAVAAQQVTDRQARQSEVPLSIRVGLAVGEVSSEGGDVYGTPVVEAARLVDAARPGQILCTALVKAVAGSRSPVPVADAGLLQLKGLIDPVAVCEVAWTPAEERPALPLPPLLTGAGRIFVGRDSELSRARRLWKEVVADGGRRLLLLAGEPGIGKTRLATELARSAFADGAVVLAGRCDEDLGVPYQPFVEALRHYVSHAAEPRLGRYGGELTRLVPEAADRVAGLAEPMRSDPETERYRLFDAVAAWLADASAESPVLLVLDDLHWAAKPTLLLLRHVVRSTEPLRLLMVATYRDTDIGRGDQLTEFLADLRREGMGDRLPLVGLDRAGVGAFIEAAAGHALPDEDSDELVRAVWEETEGNPFFVTEVMRHLAETGGVERRGGRWVTTAPIEDLGIPDGVRDVVGRRLSRLSPSAGRILGVAAIAGLEFEPAVVGVAAGLDDEELFSALEAAATARLVSEVPGGVRYRFFHALVRATLYDEISGPRRVALHRNVAQAIEALHGRHLDDYLPALTHHWSKAAVPAADADRAMEYARRAGDRALVQLAHDEAAAYYNQALTLADAAGVGPHDARRQELLISLGEAQRRAGDPAHRETLLSAAALARRRGDAHALARAALANSRAMIMATVGTIDAERVGALEAAVEAIGEADSAVRAKLLAILALETIHGDDVTRRVQLSDEALAIARRLDEPATLTAVLMARQYTINNPATLTERLSNTAEMVRLADRIGDPVTRCRAAFVRYRCVLENGDVATADSVFDAGEALAHELGQPTLLWMSGWNRAAWLARRGRFREAEETSTTTRELGRATGQGDADAFFAVQMSRVRREQGRIGEFDSEARDAWERWPIRVMEAFLAESYSEVNPAKAEEMLGRVSLDGFAALPFDYTWIATMSAWASVAIRLDDIAAMATIYEKLSPFSEQTVVSAAVVCGAVQHHLGALAAALGELDRAEEHLAAAAETHKRMALPTWVAHTAVERGAVLFRRNQPGDRDKAVTLLEQALAGAVEYGLLADERRVRELLADGGR